MKRTYLLSLAAAGLFAGCCTATPNTLTDAEKAAG